MDELNVVHKKDLYDGLRELQISLYKQGKPNGYLDDLLRSHTGSLKSPQDATPSLNT
jgi:hypothetical protein